jgi:Skp family chaperone for outer membrane proteins
MKRIFLIPLIPLLFAAAVPAGAISLVRVGYIDIEVVINTYSEKLLDTEITRRESHVDDMRAKLNSSSDSQERLQLQSDLREQNRAISILRQNKTTFRSTGNISDDTIFRIIQRDVMEAIKKTSELEGFSLVLDNSGNFIYGSDDINLTEKVLFRLDEHLLDLQDREPLAPLRLELEGE